MSKRFVLSGNLALIVIDWNLYYSVRLNDSCTSSPEINFNKNKLNCLRHISSIAAPKLQTVANNIALVMISLTSL